MPRVLLSDETGLGKTIEAGLILHRLLLNERISRVLILAPESLVHQWFVELYRRFNLVFSLFNSDFCHGNGQPESKDVNPFFEAQTGISSINWLASWWASFIYRCLIYLKKNNPAIRQEEIDAARRQACLVSESVLNAGLRLDAVRLIRQE